MHRRWLVRRGIAAGLGALWTMSISAAVRADPRPQIIGVGNVAALAATGGISPAALPGYQLRLVRSEWRPDSPPDVQRRSGACVACVGSGVFTFAVDVGVAIIWPSHGPDPARAIRITSLDPPFTCQTGDCVAFDADTVASVLSAHPHGDEHAVLWEARLSLIPLWRSWQCE